MMQNLINKLLHLQMGGSSQKLKNNLYVYKMRRELYRNWRMDTLVFFITNKHVSRAVIEGHRRTKWPIYE